MRGWAYKVRPSKFPFLKKKLTTLTGTTSFPQCDEEGTCPFSSCCCCSMTGRAGTLPVVFSFPFGRDKEGHTPSSSCCCHFKMGRVSALPILFCFLFDVTRRRGMPLLVVLLPFQHDGEGTGPPCRVLVSFLMRHAPPCRVVAIST